MMLEITKRRWKRWILDSIARVGYDVVKDPEAPTGYQFLRRPSIGRDALADVGTILRGDVRCVVDVGAHVGQTAARLADTFAKAVIYSFEPDAASFAELAAVAQGSPQIRPIRAAVGDRNGEAEFFVNKFSQTSSLLKTAEDASRFLVSPDLMELQATVRVPMITLDQFCGQQRIDRIDVLKIDAQGYELHVLDGAATVLSQGKVPLIYLEVAFVRSYEDQPLFPDVYRYLYDRNYRLVWMYETGFHTHYYSVGANALFVLEALGRRRPAHITRPGTHDPSPRPSQVDTQ